MPGKTDLMIFNESCRSSGQELSGLVGRTLFGVCPQLLWLLRDLNVLPDRRFRYNSYFTNMLGRCGRTGLSRVSSAIAQGTDLIPGCMSREVNYS